MRTIHRRLGFTFQMSVPTPKVPTTSHQLHHWRLYQLEVAHQQLTQASPVIAENNVTRMVIPCKDHDSANILFVTRKMSLDIQECETKPNDS